MYEYGRGRLNRSEYWLLLHSVSLNKNDGLRFLCLCLLYTKSTLYKDKPLDLFEFCREIGNVYCIKYSTQQRGTIRPPHKVTLFEGKSNKNHVPTVAQIVSSIIHEAIQPKGDVVSVVKN